MQQYIIRCNDKLKRFQINKGRISTMNYFIGVDVGTTSTKAVLYDQNATVLDQFSQGYSLYRDASGMAEQNPTAIVAAVEKVIHDAA